jgi:hypothetical protein
MTEKACHDIREVKKYVDSRGREVLEFVKVFGKEPESFVKGAVVIRVNAITPTGMRMPQDIRMEFRFPDGVGVKKAFEMFDEVAEKEVNRWKAEQDERAKAASVVGARSMPQLLGLDGKPIQAKG